MNGFKFGLECEYLIIDKKNNRPLWYKELDFEELYECIEKIDLKEIPSLEGLDPEEAHKKILPYVVEGYHLKNEENTSYSMLPKGIEIRTPICHSVEETLECLKTLYKRLENGLDSLGYRPVALSHHPSEFKFMAPRCNRRHDYWKWALEVMSTYGPDVNISFPVKTRERIFSDLDDFHQLINYYSPALTALSLSSPFYKNGLKKSNQNSYLKSIRTYKRSTIAPAIEIHEKEKFRIEFKFFEMSNELIDYHCYFLLCLGVSLSQELKGRALEQDRIYELGMVASNGLAIPSIQEKLKEIFSIIPKTLEYYGFNPSPLKKMKQRLDCSTTPADKMISHFLSHGEFESILLDRARLI